MDPVSALVIALVAAWAITRGATDAAISQARMEARAAADAIREDLRGRAEEWAETLADRVDGGRSGGPATALWWGWAAVRTGQGLRDRLRREPREGERARRGGGATGSWRRIFDAAVDGARFAREEMRSRRRSHEEDPPPQERVRPEGDSEERRSRWAPPRLGVCARCGAVVARQSLNERVCVLCRAAEPDPTAREDAEADAPRADESPFDDDVVDAEVVDAPADQPASPEPAAPRHHEGDSMAPRTPGQLVPRNTTVPVRSGRPARGGGGESYTHGQWNRSVANVEQHMGELPAALEMMLHRLNTADAGRSQVKGVLALGDEIVQFIDQVRDMLTEVNRLEGPVLRAVEAAGGPDEIAGIPYLREV